MVLSVFIRVHSVIHSCYLLWTIDALSESMFRRIALALPALALVLAAQTLPPGVQKVASVGGITQYNFPNGLRVLLYPDSANPKVSINVTYLVGSRHEGYGETGMAHLLEHMDFIETTNGR